MSAISPAHAAASHDAHRDPVGARIGMWLFLFTELLLFGGMFLLYAVYRSRFSSDFHYAAQHLDSTIGALNTLILLTSSLTMALAVTALARGRRRAASVLLALTIAAGLVFLVDKYFEWAHKFEHALVPGSATLMRHTPGENVFYGLYFAMTGLHGLHVLAGLLVLGVMLHLIARRPRRSFTVEDLATDSLRLDDAQRSVWRHHDESPARRARITLFYDESRDVIESLLVRLENCGLYWHLVDVIWIFLFPLFYLIS
jgi:cytochrome c oxidase subunit 3